MPQVVAQPSSPPTMWRNAALSTALVAGGFSVAVAAVMLAAHAVSDDDRMLESREIGALKADLARRSTDTALRERIRVRDLEIRAAFFRRRDVLATGRYLLFVGLAISIAALKLHAQYARRQPRPGTAGSNEADDTVARRSRWAVSAVGLAAAAAVLALGLTWASLLEPTGGEPTGPQGAARTAPDCASDEELAGNWPRLFGPSGLARAVGDAFPASWDVAAGTNVVWKTPLPLDGASSPVVWRDRVFLTAANRDEREVLCFSTATGELLWRTDVGAIPGGNLVVEGLYGSYVYAASTPATDGRRLYALFANADLVCLDFGGARLWAKSLGELDNSYGFATSLCTYRDTVIVAIDQKLPEGAPPRSRIVAFDGPTGAEVWSTARPTNEGWATPLVADAGNGPILVTAGSPYAIAYDPATGAELWRAKVLSGEVAPSPTVAGSLVFVAQEGAKLAAIRAGGGGDVTATHVAWIAEDDLPSVSSLVSDGTRLYVLGTSGVMTCYASETGTKLWDADLGVSFLTTPIVAAGRVYTISDEGAAVIVRAADTYERLDGSSVGEEVFATPAFVDGRIYVRGKTHLYCMGGGAQ